MDENREFQIFENYIKSACRKIMSQRKKNEVREELYSHLLEEYERNSALGMDDETAQSKAIDKMGDEEKIAEEFGALYSISPPEYMRSSLNFIIWGIALTFFQINLFTGFGEITKFIGQMLLLYGLFKLKKTEKKFNKALYLYITLEIIGIIIQGITMNIVDYTDVQVIGAFITLPLNILLYWWIFSGINNLCKKVISEDDKKPHLVLGFILYAICAHIILFASLIEFAELALITPILMLFSLCQLGRAKKILAHSEPELEFKLERTLNKTEKKNYSILVVAFAIVPIILMIAAASPEMPTEIYNPADTTVAQEEIEYAKNNMLELGFPEEYLYDLPDSEILKYSNATYLQCEDAESIHRTQYDYTTNTEEKVIICTSEVFRFYYPDGEIRIMMRVDLPDEKTAKYRNGLYLQYYSEDFVPIESGDGNQDLGKFFLALSEKDGKTLSTEYISEYTPKSGPIEKFYIAGYEFSFVDDSSNRRAYLAHSAQFSHPTMPQYTCTDAVFFWQEIPISAEQISINDMAISEFDGAMTLGGGIIKPIHRWDLYNSFDYDPAYGIKDEMIDLDEIEN